VLAWTVLISPAKADTPSGWSTVWRDDFTGSAGTTLDRSQWQYDLGRSYPGGAWSWGTGEVETMTDSTTNVALDGSGNLAITAVRDSAGNWTSGRVESARTDFAASAGGVLRVESRLKLPDVSGAAAAGYWPGVGEIDIMENINGMDATWSTLHCGNIDGGPCHEKTGLSSGPVACSSCASAFHTYAMEYDRSTSPEQMRFYTDGVLIHTVTSAQMDATTWANATHHGFFVIFNVAMGGEFPAAFGQPLPTDQTASGKPMLIDYIAVSQQSGGTTTTTPPGARNAYSRIEAESYDVQSGILTQATTDTGGGQNIAGVANGDWALYKGVDFGSTPATQFVARVASGASGGASGLVEVRLDSLDATPIGTFAIANTGGWQNWRTIPANISGVTGVHNVYITFTSGQPSDYVNLNWLTFGH